MPMPVPSSAHSLGNCEVDIELLALKEAQQQVVRRGHGNGAYPALLLFLFPMLIAGSGTLGHTVDCSLGRAEPDGQAGRQIGS